MVVVGTIEGYHSAPARYRYPWMFYKFKLPLGVPDKVTTLRHQDQPDFLTKSWFDTDYKIGLEGALMTILFYWTITARKGRKDTCLNLIELKQVPGFCIRLKCDDGCTVTASTEHSAGHHENAAPLLPNSECASTTLTAFLAAVDGDGQANIRLDILEARQADEELYRTFVWREYSVRFGGIRDDLDSWRARIYQHLQTTSKPVFWRNSDEDQLQPGRLGLLRFYQELRDPVFF
ncbi:hypothetical protein DFJ58DRAFT_868258 [Suillus subalutaceus]|uniref:uncharacterized protein n=1 Tax=Suillus subalutaceus TaxID=48586 RepID=UPI001B85CD3F|nr:uncharacterized protein DFJ58DRAFT_868258 [Suillus subalutaceus]KAG1835380.1 hypothetical protein DFJ58DRAFT_868258 [Suillus subalutaceus]